MTIAVRTDEEIQRDVMEELKWDMHVRANEIGVAVKDGIVTLTGWVDSYLKKMVAQDAAHRVRHVRAVANDIEVHLPSDAERTDADLAGAVLNALRWDVAIPTDQLEITVAKGWVTLKGEVEFAFQRTDAEHVISRLAGVKGVSNQITVEPHVSPADLQQHIEDALVRNAETDARHIQVEVHGSAVTLKGTVRSLAEKRAAEQTIWASPGITAVDNRITISPVA